MLISNGFKHRTIFSLLTAHFVTSHSLIDCHYQSFKIHKTLGVYGKYLIPIHAGAAVTHSMRGHAIFSRINPFGRPGY
jgi:hypothetical protein